MPLTFQEESIIVALRQISQAIENYSRFLLQSHGLTAPQVATLEALAEESLTPGDLAVALRLSPQTVAGILNRLERRELVVRSRHESDGRSVRVRITDAGTAAFQASPPLLRDRFRKELAKLEDWEQTQLLASLQRVATMMHATDVPVEPFLFQSPASGPAASAETAV